MPFDGRGFLEEPAVKEKVSPYFTKSEFLAWAKSKDPKEDYYYQAPANCAIAQFLKETGRCKACSVSTTDYTIYENGVGKSYDIPAGLDRAVRAGGYRTFGSLVRRLKYPVLSFLSF